MMASSRGLLALVGLLAVLSFPAMAGGGKLLGTGAVTQIEGASGAGYVPWATITGYAEEQQVGATAFDTYIEVDDFRVNTLGAALGIGNRLELSWAQQSLRSKRADILIRQEIIGAKLRLFGDLIYTDVPQVAVAVQYKDLRDAEIPLAVGADDDNDVEYYLSATKAWLAGPYNRTVVVNTTLRFSRANQLGLLGFGGPEDSGQELLAEVSVGMFLNPRWLVGAEYREKPDNLAVEEEDWRNLFIAYFPNKHVSLTGAYLDLGAVAGDDSQRGLYVSVQAAF